MPTFAFANGVSSTAGYGDRWLFNFTGTWVFNETWQLIAAINGSNVIVGAGNVTLNGQPTACFTYKNRVYLANGAVFNFSDNAVPTEFEPQGPGAGFVLYLSELGQQDAVAAFGQIQGRLAVFARKSVQIWSVDANPANFSNPQTLDNVGTKYPLSVQNQGDYDCIFLDDTGVRSLRALEVTLNATIDDVGSSIDSFVAASQVGNNSPVCSAVEPATKNFWIHINGTIYVLSRHKSSKVTAWSTYNPVGDDNTVFTPEKFIVYNGRVYCRGTNGYLYSYGGANGTTYDPSALSQPSFQTAWNNDKRPGTVKKFQAIDFVMAGNWTIYADSNPSNNKQFSDKIYDGGVNPNSTVTPTDILDSSYDLGIIECPISGTHISFQVTCNNQSTTTPAQFSSIAAHYNEGSKS